MCDDRAFVRAELRITNESPAGAVVTSAGHPADAPGRTRIDMRP